MNTEESKQYEGSILKEVTKAYDVAEKSRSLGFDPTESVDIPLARNMAERVEGLISVVAPHLVGKGMIKRIEELEHQFSPLDWRVGFCIALEVAQEKFCTFPSKREAMEVGIRVGFSYLTGGIVSAPLEGFIELKIKQRADGKEYFSVCYAGPIRGAGGTAAALSVILADYVRVHMGYAPYDPTPTEINRYVTEVYDYHERCVNLQYLPSGDELRFLMEHLPVEVNGDPTELIEVSNYKDVPRVETNRVRGGLCLVVAEGISQKAPKLWKRLSQWGEEMGLSWGFLDEFLTLQKKIKAKQKTKKVEETQKIKPNYTFIADLVAGRPVLTEPMAPGGFRLRYGRSRTTGFSAAGIHPATMYILEKYIATGTQLKIERPGKAAAMTPCETIEGPIVRIKDGSVLQLSTIALAKEYVTKIRRILFLGDILINYGDFSENGHVLVPAGYCPEWWSLEIEEKLNEDPTRTPIPSFELQTLLADPLRIFPDYQTAYLLSSSLNVPLHPHYIFYWSLLSPDQLYSLRSYCSSRATVDREEERVSKIVLPIDPDIKVLLEDVGVPHLCVNQEYIVIEKQFAAAFYDQLGGFSSSHSSSPSPTNADSTNDALGLVNSLSSVTVRDKAGTFVGARMGRPEKAKQRKLTGSPHGLFPVGDEGGRLRCFQEALDTGKVTSTFPIFKCLTCNKNTIYSLCEGCGKKATQVHYCSSCGALETEECPQHGPCHTSTVQEIDISHYFQSALSQLQMKAYPDLIKGVRGTSNKDHTPEHLSKSILRSRHSVYVNKDGTTRFDMSELPITHFTPKEVGTSVPRLCELGYTVDVCGNPLTSEDQLLELKPQDLILPNGSEALDEQAAEVLFRVSQYVDELLVKLYEQDSYYNLTSKSDLVGHLVIGLAPHISAGIIGRIIGFSHTQALYAHPFYHAAMRRDADGDEACVILLMDALLNFSRSYLPNKRGSRTMDAPLVLTPFLLPAEIDDQAHGIDIVTHYPLEFYDATLKYEVPWSVQIPQVKNRIGTEEEYGAIGFTHGVSSINQGINCSAYKSLPSMQDKLQGQMVIAQKLRAVDESNVARYVIEKHFLKDIKGNLKKFSMQQFRCVKCNTKYRRPPLVGKCTSCGGKIIFTISEGSVVKYLGPSISLAEKYGVPKYLQETLEILKRSVEDNFGKEKEKQEGLGRWFG